MFRDRWRKNKGNPYDRICGTHTDPVKSYFPNIMASLAAESHQLARTRTHRGGAEVYDLNNDTIAHTIFRFQPCMN